MTGEDLWQALDRASGPEVGALLPSFLDQPGPPLVTIEPTGDGRVVSSQRRFLNAGAEAQAQLWTIPVALRYECGGETRLRERPLNRRSESPIHSSGRTLPRTVAASPDEAAGWNLDDLELPATPIDDDAEGIVPTDGHREHDEVDERVVPTVEGVHRGDPTQAIRQIVAMDDPVTALIGVDVEPPTSTAR